MKQLRMLRVSYHVDGTFGVLLDQSTPFALTLEPEWKDNRRDISCIPEGQYLCRRYWSARFGETFEVTAVPDRTAILFHKGNIENDSRGCILVGEQYGRHRNKTAVLHSGAAFTEFLGRLRGQDTFRLVIEA